MVRFRALGCVSRCFGPPTLDRNVKLRKYKHFERWATAKGIAVSRVAWHTVVEVCQQAIVIVVCSTLFGITGRCACFCPWFGFRFRVLGFVSGFAGSSGIY